MTVNEKLANDAIKRALELQRIIGGQRKEVKKLFATLESNISSIIAKHNKLDKITAPAKKKVILQQIITEANKTIYKEIEVFSTGFYEDLGEVARHEAEMVVKDINKRLPKGMHSKLAPLGKAGDFPFETWVAGKTAAEYISGIEYSARTEIVTSMRQGFLLGENTESLIKRVTGFTDDKGIYYKGILDGAGERTARAAVRTIIMGVSNEARKRTYEKNSDVVKGVEWIATLDTATCFECANLDGKAWTLDGEPIDGNGLDYQTPPVHINCRCTLAPVIKSWEELGLDLPEMDESTRSSMDGQVPESKTFENWFAELSKKRQEEYLGKGRWELFKGGKISFGDMIDQNGRELTIEELKKMTS